MMDRRLAAAAGLAILGVVALLAWWVLAEDSGAPSEPAATPASGSNTPTTGTSATQEAPGNTPTPIPVSLEPIPDLGMALPGRQLGPMPQSSFPVWTGTNAIIYDTQTGDTIDLGPGEFGTFSPDGKWAIWKAGDRTPESARFSQVGEMWVINLESGERRAIGDGRGATFVDNERLALLLPLNQQQNAEWKLFNIHDLQPSADQTTPGVVPTERLTSTGHILVSTPVTRTGLPRGGYGTTHFQLLDRADRHLVMEFDAYRVVDATETELVVASAWTEIPTQPFVSHPVNLFFLDVRTGEARHFAFARASAPNWPLSASADYVLWTNDFCSESGHTEVILQDRDGLPYGILREDTNGQPVNPQPGSDEAYMVLTPRGLIAEGTFGARALIDPVTMNYVAVLPEVELVPALQGRGPVEPRWSDDHRYAGYWQGGGHGGLC